MKTTAAVAALVCAGLFGGCTRSPPDVLMIVVDTLRADHLGCYGYGRPTSPNIDALAARGVRFARAHATSSWTAPSVASMLTGLAPAVHGVDAATAVLGESVPTIAEAFRRAGYRTVAFASNPAFVSARMGFGRGFDQFTDLHGPPVSPDKLVNMVPINAATTAFVEEADGEAVSNAAIDWLTKQAHASEPHFLFVHYMDPHADYFPPPELAARFGVTPGAPLTGVDQRPLLRTFRAPSSAADVATLVGLYDAEIAFVDIHIQRLLEFVERSGRPTLVVLTADHGEEFGDHGGLLHGLTLYEEQLHVPLIMAGPQLSRGIVVEEPVSLTGLWATMAALVLLPAPPQGTGRGFAESTRGGKAPSSILFADLDNSTSPLLHQRAVLDGDWKLIAYRGGERRLFDLGKDPGEHDNRKSVADGVGAALDSALAARDALAREARRQTETQQVVLSPEDRARMHALGYGD